MIKTAIKYERSEPMDPQMTIMILASSVVTILGAYLTESGKAAAKKIGEDVYGLIKAQFANRPTAQEALVDYEQSPDNTDFQAALRVQVAKLLRDDESLMIQLQELVQKENEEKGQGTIVISQSSSGQKTTLIGQVSGNINIDHH